MRNDDHSLAKTASQDRRFDLLRAKKKKKKKAKLKKKKKKNQLK